MRVHGRKEGQPDVKLGVLRADPRSLRPAIGESTQAATVLSLTAGVRGTLSLWWHAAAFSIGSSAPAADAAALAGGVPLSSPAAQSARAAAGIQDEDGTMVWVELWPDARTDADTARVLDGFLERLGCSSRMLLPGDARALLGGALDITSAPLPDDMAPVGSRLVRARAPDAHPVFDATPIVPIQVWQPLQAKRVRYFYKPSAGSSSAVSNTSSPQPR